MISMMATSKIGRGGGEKFYYVFYNTIVREKRVAINIDLNMKKLTRSSR